MTPWFRMANMWIGWQIDKAAIGNRRGHRGVTSGRWIIWVATLACLTGCQRGVYDASSLPLSLRAYPIVDVQALDLSSLASASASSQRIYPGDSLNLTVVTGAESRMPQSWPLRVSQDGGVDVPLVGRVQLAGLDLQTAQNVVRTASIQRGVYRQPTVSLEVNERQTNRITVIGAVDEPGDYDLPVANSNLLSAISVAGGLSEDADRIIEIRQTPLPLPTQLHQPQLPENLEIADEAHQQVGYQVPLDPIAQQYGGNSSEAAVLTTQLVRVDLATATQRPAQHGYNLRDGAVVMVRKRSPRYIHVLGLVRKPDQFTLPANQNVRVLDALAMAGGRTYSVADRVLIVRQQEGHPEPTLIEVSVADAKANSEANLLLTDGDVVSVEETPTTLVVGAISQFVRFGVNGSVSAF